MRVHLCLLLFQYVLVYVDASVLQVLSAFNLIHEDDVAQVSCHLRVGLGKIRNLAKCEELWMKFREKACDDGALPNQTQFRTRWRHIRRYT